MNSREQVAQVVSDAASASAAKSTYFGGALSAVGGIALSSEFIALVGLLIAVAGWATQLYFGIRRDRREAAEHAIRVSKLRGHDKGTW